MEAVLALGVLSACVHGMTVVGAYWMSGQQALQFSRIAAFTSALGMPFQSKDAPSDMSVALTPVAPARSADSCESRQTGHRNASGDVFSCIGNAHAALLSRDWLGNDTQLQRAQAIIHRARIPVFGLRVESGRVSDVRRHIVIATDTGHGGDDTRVSHRLSLSSLGWEQSRQRSRGIAERLSRDMAHVDAWWGRDDPDVTDGLRDESGTGRRSSASMNSSTRPGE